MKATLVVTPWDRPETLGFARNARGVFPPLLMGYAAAVLEEHGHEVRFFDASALGWHVVRTVDAVVDERPDLVAVSCFVAGKAQAAQCIEAIEERLPGVPVVWIAEHVNLTGSWHPATSIETLFAESPAVRFVLRGEPGHALAEIMDRLGSGADLHDVPGLSVRESDGIHSAGPPPKALDDLDALPFPARHVFDPACYHPMPLMISCPDMPAATVLTSRGCPWARCGFCYKTGRHAVRYQRRSPGNVVQELRLLAKDGIRFVLFIDDNFCMDPPWIQAFCDLLRAEPQRVRWSAFARVDTVTPEMLAAMAAAGCIHLAYGFESGNQATLDLIDKGITLDQSRRAVAWTRRAGIEMRGHMILGLPRETPAMAEQTIRFACKLNTEYMFFQPYFMMEGTPLAEWALDEGCIEQRDAVTGRVPFYVPDAFDGAGQVEALLRRAYRQYYLRPGYIARALWRARKPEVLMDYLQKARLAVGFVTGG